MPEPVRRSGTPKKSSSTTRSNISSKKSVSKSNISSKSSTVKKTKSKATKKESEDVAPVLSQDDISPNRTRNKSSQDDISFDHIGTPKPRTGYKPTQLERILNIKWSKYIPHTPTSKQLAALMLQDVKELLFGGALGGGKSDFLAYEALRFCDLPDFTSIIFRRQLTDLKQPKSLIPRVAQWLEPFRVAGDCRYIGADHKWEFKTKYPGTDIPGPPAMLQWGYIGEAAIRERYQSAEYQLIAFDELGQWDNPTDWLFMCSRCRMTVCPIHGKDDNENPIWDDNCHICAAKRLIPLRRRAAMNPGPAWVKRRFRIVPDPSVYKTRQAALIAIQEGEKIQWVGTHPYRKFIPSYLTDNPHLDAKAYKEMLKEMTPEERSRLEDGNWEARKNARFKRKWIYGQYINVYDHGYCFLDEDMNESVTVPYSSLKMIFTTVDSAATARLFADRDDELIAAGDGRAANKPSSTCIGVWGVTREEQLLWLDFYKFRKELPDIIETLSLINQKWPIQFNKIECNGLGIGVAQFAEMAGIPVRKNIRKKDKLENSLSAQMMMKYGQIYFPANTPWAEMAEDDIFNWTGHPEEEDDTVDVLSDAALEITPRMASKIVLPNKRLEVPGALPMTSSSRGAPQYGLLPSYGQRF